VFLFFLVYLSSRRDPSETGSISQRRETFANSPAGASRKRSFPFFANVFKRSFNGGNRSTPSFWAPFFFSPLPEPFRILITAPSRKGFSLTLREVPSIVRRKSDRELMHAFSSHMSPSPSVDASLKKVCLYTGRLGFPRGSSPPFCVSIFFVLSYAIAYLEKRPTPSGFPRIFKTLPNRGIPRRSSQRWRSKPVQNGRLNTLFPRYRGFSGRCKVGLCRSLPHGLLVHSHLDLEVMLRRSEISCRFLVPNLFLSNGRLIFPLLPFFSSFLHTNSSFPEQRDMRPLS